MNWKKLMVTDGVRMIEFLEVILVRKMSGEAIRLLVPERYEQDLLVYALEERGGWAIRAALNYDAEKHLRLLQDGAVEIDKGRATLHLLPAVASAPEGVRLDLMREVVRRLRTDPQVSVVTEATSAFLTFMVTWELTNRGLLPLWRKAVEVHGAAAMRRLVLATFGEEVA